MNSELTKHNLLQYGENNIERVHILTVLMFNRYMKNFNKHVSRKYVVNLNINYEGGYSLAADTGTHCLPKSELPKKD